MEKEVVSIIIPCYNQAEYLSEAMESVLGQTYANWECIIVNDGSTDDSETIALQWVEKDKRIKYLKKVNGGLSNARNYGIKHSIGEYILPLDADDKIGTQYLELAVKTLQQDGQLKVVYCRAELFGVETGEWKLPQYNFKELLLYNTIFCSAVYRRKDYDLTKGYDEALIYGGEDWNFWISLLKHGGNVIQLDSIQFYYRKKLVSMHTELSKNKEKDLYTNNIIFKNHFELYQQFFGDPLTAYKNAYRFKEEVEVMHRSRIYNMIRRLWDLKKKLKI